MTENSRTRVSTKQETPTTARQRARFGYRYAYARSMDCRTTGDTGQDYLIIFEHESRFAFALCDGVSQSFYGDLAARLLGDALVEWLFNLALPIDEAELQANLSNFLQLLTVHAGEQVSAYQLPENLSLMLKNALDKKRAIGSESTFIVGLVDVDANTVILAWMGDSNIRIWGNEGEQTAQLGDTFLKRERWSTAKGPVGQAHVFVGSTEQIVHFAAYSDGLEKLNQRFEAGSPSNRSIDLQISEAGEDDMSFVEFWLGQLPDLDAGAPEKPQGVKAHYSTEMLDVTWQPVAGAALYEVELCTKSGETIIQPTASSSLQMSAEKLPANVQSLRVRAWKQEEPGEWGDAFAVQPEPVKPTPPIAQVEAPAPQPAPSLPLPVLQPVMPPPPPVQVQRQPTPVASRVSAQPSSRPVSTPPILTRSAPRPVQPAKPLPARNQYQTKVILALAGIFLLVIVLGGIGIGMGIGARGPTKTPKSQPISTLSKTSPALPVLKTPEPTLTEKVPETAAEAGTPGLTESPQASTTPETESIVTQVPRQTKTPEP